MEKPIKADYLIVNGIVMDPSQNLSEEMDVAVRNGKIVSVLPKGEWKGEADCTIDASDCMVFPGLIDFHTHIYHAGSGICIHPDMMIANGITATCDAGSSGCMNYEAFHQTAAVPRIVKVKSFLNVYSGGQLCHAFDEILDVNRFDEDQIFRVVEKYRDSILGLKIRIPRTIVGSGEQGLEPLKRTVQLAEAIGDGFRVAVHVTDGPVPAERIADVLRSGDIFAHCFHGKGDTIIGDDGHVLPGILEARKRGVLFDVANGKGNFGIRTAKAALEDGFLPDIISSDMTPDKYNMPPYCKNLPLILSKFLALGMPLEEIVRRTTEIPAAVMGMKDKIGTLKAGSAADVAIFKLKDQEVLHKDWCDEEFVSHQLLVPQLTMCDGVIQFCQTDFFN